MIYYMNVCPECNHEWSDDSPARALCERNHPKPMRVKLIDLSVAADLVAAIQKAEDAMWIAGDNTQEAAEAQIVMDAAIGNYLKETEA